MRRALVVAVLALAACGSGDAIVDLTIGVDPSVPSAKVSLVRSLTIDASGVSTLSVKDAVSSSFASSRQERIVVRSSAGGMATLGITARDATGAALLFGQTSFTLDRGSEKQQSVTLSALGTQLDGGTVDLAPSDLAGTAMDLPATALDLLAPGCPGDVLLCDGFESGTVDATRWDATAAPSGGAVTVDNTRAHRGQYSLHTHLDAVTSGATGIAEIGEAHTFTPAGSTFFVRAWYYFSASTSTVTTTLIDSGQNASPFDSISLSTDSDALSAFDSFVTPNNYTASTTPKVPLQTWTCIEFEVDTGTPNQLHAWIDGVAVTQLDLMEATRGTPDIGVIYFGLSMYPPNTSAAAVDAWIDDVIFDHAAIGCAK